MCTAVFKKEPYPVFGRNLDVPNSYGEKVLFTPREQPFSYRYLPSLKEGYALLGTGILVNDYPLFFDAMNEKGLALAGLNYPHNACFYPHEENPKHKEIAPYELFTYLLRKYEKVDEIRRFFSKAVLVNEPFSSSLPLAPLHYIFVDSQECLVLEQDKDGLHLYENPYGVLTNSPSFFYQVENLRKLRGVGPSAPKDNFLSRLDFTGVGTGTIGLPGDWSSPSRFQKVAYANLHTKETNQEESLLHLSQILDSVRFIRGEVIEKGNEEEVTLYQSLMDLKNGHYFYKKEKDFSFSSYSFHDALTINKKTSFYL